MELPVLDIADYLAVRQRGLDIESLPSSSFARKTCMDLASCFREMGAVIIRDPRCTAAENDAFLDMMERYFGQPHGEKMKQARPNLHYQVGATPAGVELPRCAVDSSLRDSILAQPEQHRATIPSGPDPKWRYMWRIGQRPKETNFQELNSEPVVPEGLPEFGKVMDAWGSMMISAVEVVAEMAAIGFGLPSHSFTALMHQGPHLLAPTGCDLEPHSQRNSASSSSPAAPPPSPFPSVVAGYHYDLNFLTIHGRCRYPGLFIWLRDGQRVPVRIPDGCLLLQCGKQMEWLTGGEVRAGMHEVVVTEDTVRAVQAAKERGKSVWRVSSTVFGHIASDATLEPVGHFRNSPEASEYPPIVAGEYVEKELAVIKLKDRVAMQDKLCNSAQNQGFSSRLEVS